MRSSLNRWYRRHENFILLLLLFATFRLLTLLAFRPGGLVLDFSDFYWYREFAQLTRQGYIPYESIWTTYPPLFPALMVMLWEWSVRLPPWEFNNLWFTVLMGGAFLLFEIGNFILLYLIAQKLSASSEALKSAWIYAGLFVPVYTITGWFESYPLFFFLLSLYLLLQNRPWLSAIFSGIGFMTKLIPLILLPVGVKLLPVEPARLRLRLPILNVNVDLVRVIGYLGLFTVTVVLIGYPYYLRNPDLILGSLQITGARLPWESVWALLEGNYEYGVIPLDMRQLSWQSGQAPASQLPWLWITALFAALYTWLYTRRIEWQQPRVAVAFTALTVCIFFLYSKGYSPQWLGWVLIFTSLLLPNLRGVLYAIILSIANIIEANFFFVMFPTEAWLLQSTILLRTGLLIVLSIEFGLQIWPHLETESVIKLRTRLLAVGFVALLIGSLFGASRLLQRYPDIRLAQSPYQASISWLSEQPVKEALLLNDHTTYDWFYPYLRQTHQFYMLDDYADPAGPTVSAKTETLLAQIAAENDAVWVFDVDPAVTTAAETALQAQLNNLAPAHQADIDGGRLYLFILK